MYDLIRKAKGVLIFFGFFAFALSILAEPNVDVQRQLTEHWINSQTFAGVFLMAGGASLLYAFKGWNWNGLLFAPYFAFTGFALEAAHVNPNLSGSTATAYLFLGGLLIIEFVVDNEYLELLKDRVYSGRND